MSPNVSCTARLAVALAMPVGLPATGAAATITVQTTIQAAVDRAQPGDTILVPAGTYRESVLVAKDRITIQGAPGAILEGAGAPGRTGITVAPQGRDRQVNDFTLIGMQIRDYVENGVLLKKVHKFLINSTICANNLQYGIFPIFSRDGIIEFNLVSGANDTAIYVGQSSNVLVQRNTATDSTVGFEVENSSHVTVEGNWAARNSTGFLIDVLPGLDVTDTSQILLRGNVAVSNNRASPVTDAEDVLALLPSGVGILNVGGDDVLVQANQVLGNLSIGIGLVQLPPFVAAADPRVDPFADNNEIRMNVVLGNGGNPDPKLAALALTGADLIWDGSGTKNCWKDNLYQTSFPQQLPSCR